MESSGTFEGATFGVGLGATLLFFAGVFFAGAFFLVGLGLVGLGLVGGTLTPSFFNVLRASSSEMCFFSCAGVAFLREVTV